MCLSFLMGQRTIRLFLVDQAIRFFSIASCISPFAQMIYFRLYFCFESLFSFYLIIFLREGEANGSAYEVQVFGSPLSEMQFMKKAVSEKQNCSVFCHLFNQKTYVTVVNCSALERKCWQGQKCAIVFMNILR